MNEECFRYIQETQPLLPILGVEWVVRVPENWGDIVINPAATFAAYKYLCKEKNVSSITWEEMYSLLAAEGDVDSITPHRLAFQGKGRLCRLPAGMYMGMLFEASRGSQKYLRTAKEETTQ